MAPFEMGGSYEAQGTRFDLLQELMHTSEEGSILHEMFKPSIDLTESVYVGAGSPFERNAAWFAGLEGEALEQSMRPEIMEQVSVMLDGFIDSNGNQTLGLNEISTWQRSPEFWTQNTKQQAGYAAEVVSTVKENMIAAHEGTGLTTYRADDRPDLGFAKNDQFVDKIRVNSAGEVVERIQTKFFGNNGKEWVQKMMSQRCDKYYDNVDKIECPSDYFDDAKAYIAQRRESLNRQLERVTADGKTEVAESIQARIDKLGNLDRMIEKSTVSTDEARYAREHPKRYAAKVFASETFEASVKEGTYGAALAAGITFVSSAVIHGTECFNGEITAEEMVREVATETGTAGAIGGATGFISAVVANTMQTSSCELIRNVGGSCLPASAVAFAVESYDSVMDYAQGAIEADELMYDLGHNAATIAGGAVGGAKVGAMAGSAFGPAGTLGGGFIGGLVGSAVASGAYETAMKYAPDAAEGIAEQARGFAQEALDVISNEYPERLESARTALNDYFIVHEVPVSI